MRLKVIKNKIGIVNRYNGDVITYTPWHCTWQDMTEQERVDKGIFIHCYGHGEFERLDLNVDVELINDVE